MIVYDKYSGEIIGQIPNDQNIYIFYCHYSDDFKGKLKSIVLDIELEFWELKYYKIIDNKLVRKTDTEILEINRYGKVLIEEERQLQSLKPSPSEVKKAENIVEILTLIQEVI